MTTFGWIGLGFLTVPLVLAAVVEVWLYVSTRNIPPHS